MVGTRLNEGYIWCSLDSVEILDGIFIMFSYLEKPNHVVLIFLQWDLPKKSWHWLLN